MILAWAWCNAVCFAQTAASQAVFSKEIEAQPLAQALDLWARQTGLQVIYGTEMTAGKTSPGARAGLSAKEALQEIVRGSGLTVTWLNDHTATLSAGHGATSLVPTGAASTAEPGGAAGAGLLEEVIVSAQKRSERLQDVPVPVSVLNSDELTDNSQLLLRDYYSSVPGLNVAPNVEGQQFLSIRGITTGGFASTVAVLVDDVPYGHGGPISSVVPDVDPGDLARIEVLRGPQGTLYGSDSLGGLIKYVTIDPSTTGFSGRVSAGVSDVHNGAQSGYNFRGSVNVPLSDQLAVRASVFTRQDPGYIDNPTFHLVGVNEAQAYGGRFATLWKPSEDFSLKLSALYQKYKSNGSTDIVPTAGALNQNDQYLPNFGGGDTATQAYSAVVKAKIANADLTSITGYDHSQVFSSWQSTYAFSASAESNYAVSGAPIPTWWNENGFSQELRLSVPVTSKLEWLFGGYYTHLNNRLLQDLIAVNTITGDTAGTLFQSDNPSRFQEYAAFTDVTYHFTDRFNVQFGGRESHLDVATLRQITYGLLYPTPSVALPTDTTANVFTYLVTPQFKVSPDLMIYARIASGYRPGGANQSTLTTAGAPAHYDPDKTNNYEIGVKGDFFDGRLTIDSSAYYISWKDIQISLVTSSESGYTANGSGAKSEGVEFSLESRPVEGTTLTAWVDYDNAVLTQAFPANSTVYGAPGERLPNTPRFSGNLSLQQTFPLSNGVGGFAGATLTYIGDRVGTFGSTAERQDLPGYAKVDLRVGFVHDSWKVNVFLNNATDSRGVVSGGLGYYPPFAFTYIQPRTAGVSLDKAF